ncbi:hypothetical protein GCM10009651_20520 [Microbacterium natoriense]|uniref:hypothetical protein n=1 Tax=Microbacterium natoriense TaxID=284570 RepID=UPI0031D0B544
MTWIPLNVHRSSDDAQWLRDTFAVDASKYPHQNLGGTLPTRALDWVVQQPAPRAWVNIDTGSLLLVEAIGGEELGAGSVTARLWIAATEQVVELATPRRYTDDEFPPVRAHATVLDAVLAEVAGRLPGTGIPELTVAEPAS